MKHFFNRREDIVTEALDGLLLSTPEGQLARLDTYPAIKVIVRADWDKSRVAVISGGGAGHEPSHAGFVGKGMLTAAVSGEIFASPSVDAVLTAIRAVTGNPGCLLVVKNYTGDRLNFGLAAEKARAEGFRVEMVIVADDIALPELPQPRGVAGTLFIHKIAGHMAEAGEELDAIAVAARAAAADIVSLGMSLSTCSIPGQAHEDRLGPNEGELGLGIHGEPGAERIALQQAAAIVETMVQRLDGMMQPGRRHALLINNLGAVPPLEMGLIAKAVLASSLADRVDLILGPAPLMTALNMNGFSLSLIALNEARVAALTSSVAPRAWVAPVRRHALSVLPAPKADTSVPAGSHGRGDVAGGAAAAVRVIETVCNRLISLEADLNRLDSRTGDGDTGSTVATGARSVLALVPKLPLDDRAATCSAIGDTLGTSMGGSSGVLLSILFTAAGKKLADGGDFAQALSAGLERVTFYGGAVPGDRTMVDALAPAIRALASEGLSAAAAAARHGAAATGSMMRAKAGRSAYLAARDLEGVPDPGAEAVAAAFEAAAGADV